MKRILLIDDNRDILETFNYMLTDLNYSVTTCIDSTEGLLKAINEDFELILTDYEMPNKNGCEIIKEVKRVKPNSAIYLLTGYYEENVINKAREVGATGIMNKPFEVSKIISILKYL